MLMLLQNCIYILLFIGNKLQSRSSGEIEFFILVRVFDNVNRLFSESWFYFYFIDRVNEVDYIDELNELEKNVFCKMIFLY